MRKACIPCSGFGGMNVKRRVLLVVFLLTLAILSSTASAALKILPEMELLAGVLTQTTWMERRGPRGPGNEYYRALKEFFAEYQDHEAVAIAQRLTERGFTYDAPPALICHLGPLPELALLVEYSDYLVERAGGRDVLEEFRLALVDLAEQSNFLAFFSSWEAYLDECLQPAREDFRAELPQMWLEEFFGWAPTRFELIMAPSMFPGGGYGVTVWDGQGEPAAIQIIREYGSSSGAPEFPTGSDLEMLTIHELGHSFVNPTLEAYPERARKLRPLFWSVRKVMRAQAYPFTSTFLNEQVVRSVEVLAARDLFGPELAEIVLENHEGSGFYLTAFVAEQLDYYQAHRSLYPTFRDFAPYLFDQLEAYVEENCTFWERFFSLFLR